MTDQKRDTKIITTIEVYFTEHASMVLSLIIVVALTVSPWFAPISSSQPAQIRLLFSAMIGLSVLVWKQTRAFKDLQEITQDTASSILHESYPSAHWERLLCAKELWFTGLNLRRMVFPDHTQDLEWFVKNGGVLKVILLSQSNREMLKYGARQDEGRTEPKDVDRWSLSIDNTITCLRELQRMAPNPKNVQIRTTDYPMPFGIDAADIESQKGVIYVRFYPFFCGEGDKPILVMRGNQSQWFSFYKKQLQLQWDKYATDI